MNLPGSTWGNPIWYGDWRIWSAQPVYAWAYAHIDWDEDDDRIGFALSVVDAKRDINDFQDFEASAEPRPEASGTPLVSQTPLSNEKQPNPNHRDEAG